MATIAEVYCKGVRQQTKWYFAQWMPNAVIELGTVGTLIDKYYFEPSTTLAALGFSFHPDNPEDVVPDPSATPLKLSSGQTASLTFKTAGEVNPSLPNVPQAKAGIAVEFASEGAFVLEAAETFEPRIRNVAALEDWMMAEYKAKRWHRDWAVIVSLVKAPAASIVISESGSAKLELSVKGEGKVGSVQLGDAAVEFQPMKQSGSVLDLSNSRDVTPIFKLAGLRPKGFLGLGGVQPGTVRGMRKPRQVPEHPPEDAAEVVMVDLLGGDELA